MPTALPSPRSSTLHRCLAMVLFLTGGLFLGVSIWFFNIESANLRSHLEKELAQISETRAGQASSWRKGHIRDANAFAHGVHLLLTQTPAASLLDDLPREPLVHYLSSIYEDRNLDNILITDRGGNLLVAHDEYPSLPEPGTRRLIDQVAQSGQTTMGDPYWCQNHQRVHIDTAAVIRNPQGDPIGIWVMIKDLTTLSLPPLAHWPMGTHGRIEVIIPAGEDHAFVVTPDPTNNLTRVIEASPLNAFTKVALQRKTGWVEAVDDRDDATLAHVHPVPESSWLLIAKVSGYQYYQEATERYQLIALIIGSLVLLVGFATALFFFLRQVNLNQQLTAAQQISDESERKYRDLFNATSDAIVLHDAASGNILEVNQAMLRMYGFDRSEEVQKLSIGELSANEPPYDDATAHEYLHKTIENGFASFEWLARRKNRQTFWVEVSLRYTSLSDRNCILAIVRDISARKREAEHKQKQLDELKRWQQTILGREKRMIQLKQEVNDLLEQQGQPPRYTPGEGNGHT